MIGEIGLAGEIRRVAGRGAAAGRGGAAGVRPRVVPPDSGVERSDLRVQEVGDVAVVLDNLR